MLKNSAAGKGRLWQRNFVLAILINFSLAVVFYLFTTTMAVYAIKHFSVSEVGGGLAAGGFVLGAVVARLFGGKYLDLMGRKKVLIFSLIAAVVITFAHLFIANYALLILFRFLHGITFGSSSNAVTTIAFSLIPPARRGEGTSYYAVSSTLGSAVGPIVGVVFADTFGSGSYFWVGSFIPLIAFGLAFLVDAPERVLSSDERAEVKTFRWKSLIDWVSFPVSVIMIIPGLGYSAILAFVETYGLENGVVGVSGKYFAIFAATVLVSRLFVGRLQDNLGDNMIMVPVLVALAASLFVLVVLPFNAAIILSAVLLGFGFGSVMPALQTIAVRVGRPQDVALVTSTFFLLTDIGVGSGPILSGVLIRFFGFDVTFLFFGFLVLASILLYWRVHGRVNRQPRA